MKISRFVIVAIQLIVDSALSTQRVWVAARFTTIN